MLFNRFKTLIAVTCVLCAAAATSFAQPESALADRIERGDRKAALEMIARNAPVNSTQPDGTTPLHWAVYRVDEELVKGPQRWNPGDIGRFMLFFGPVSSVFDITTYLVMWFVFGANSAEHQTLFQSGWFIEGLMTQTLVVHMIRTQKIPFIQSRPGNALLVMTGLIMAAGIFIPMGPVAHYFKLQALPLSYFPILAVILASYMVLTQGMKRYYTRRFGWQ